MYTCMALCSVLAPADSCGASLSVHAVHVRFLQMVSFPNPSPCQNYGASPKPHVVGYNIIETIIIQLSINHRLKSIQAQCTSLNYTVILHSVIYDEKFRSASVDLTECWELVLEAHDDKSKD